MPPPQDAPSRRERTVELILDRAVTIMGEVGVAGLTMTTLARAMAIQPPSLYKYFSSVRAVYDALFLRGQQENLAVFERALADAPAGGLVGLRAALVATARWAVEHPVVAQLLFWRPVPGFVPSDAAMAPAERLVGRLHAEVATAVARGELGPAAAGDEALVVLASLHFGVLSQHLANQPDRAWAAGDYTRAYDRVLDLFVAGYAP